MVWPAQSPDLNPIEHLWFHLKRKLAEYPEPPKGIAELWERVEREWERIEAATCQELIQSMPRRVQESSSQTSLADYNEAAQIKAAIRYADLDEAEVWQTLTAASGGDWDAFVVAVKDLYPGLQDYRAKAMRSQDELGEYHRKFMKISAPLIANKKLADTERDAFFLDRFPRAIADRVHHRLSIIRADLHPDDAYPMEDIMDAAKFLLTGAAIPLRPKAANSTARHHSNTVTLSDDEDDTPERDPSVSSWNEATHNGSGNNNGEDNNNGDGEEAEVDYKEIQMERALDTQQFTP
ncbi:hypothetical protein PAXINDRAFT_6524 [Paxillus involutus ATCC 200175]|nr:hypothetical protein PAXINDRAFT_6524 [Paxillus involutus ATCC 200175]